MLALLGAAVLCGWVSLGVRSTSAVRVPAGESGESWTVNDPDSLYHARRLQRAMLEGGVAPRDPRLAYPVFESTGGAPIPWPGGYTRVLLGLVDVDPSDRLALEQRVATLPAAFAALTSSLVALLAGALVAARGIGGAGSAALLAGLLHALCFGSVRYSFIGMGDHHAWVSLVTLAMAGLVSAGLESASRGRVMPSAILGLLAGLAAGVSLVSWVASLVAVVVLQAVMGAWILRGRHPRPAASASLLMGFHAGALGVIWPEVQVSPWPAHDVVNLSWFHVFWLGAVGSTWLALQVDVTGRGERGLRLGPVVGIAWLLLAMATQAGRTALLGVLDGFAWAGATTTFMSSISESQPLLDGSNGLGDVGKWLGWGVFAVPLAWLHLARGARPRDLPWMALVPVLVTMALVQRRFSEGASGPLAVLLAAGFVIGLSSWTSRRPLRFVPFLLALLFPPLSNPSVVERVRARLEHEVSLVETPTLARQRALRELMERQRPEPGRSSGAVLAEWDLGHLIEWGAERPTLATNFGDYIDCEAFLDPWRVLFGSDDAGAEECLIRRRVGHVVVTDDPWRNLAAAQRALGDAIAPEGQRLVQRLLPPGHPDRSPAAGEPGFLRLVDEATVRYDERDDGAVGWCFQVVPGARIEATGEPGDILEVRIPFRPPSGGTRSFLARAQVGEDGVARVRVPYPTGIEDRPVVSRGAATWTLGAGAGELEIPEAAVLSGQTLRISNR